MTKPKRFNNEDYSNSPLIWFSYWFSRWYKFALLVTLVSGITFLLGKITFLGILFFSILTWGAIQLFNLFIIVVLQAPLIQFIDINYQNKSLTISYKYPFGKIKYKILSHNSVSFRVWQNRFESLTTIKTEDSKITIREGQFGLDLLDLWKLNIELDKIGSKYRKFYDFWYLTFCLWTHHKTDRSGGCQHGFVSSGADRINLNFRKYPVPLFRLTETYCTVVSNSSLVIYIGRRSGRWVSNSPPATSPVRWKHLNHAIIPHQNRSKPIRSQFTPGIRRTHRQPVRGSRRAGATHPDYSDAPQFMAFVWTWANWALANKPAPGNSMFRKARTPVHGFESNGTFATIRPRMAPHCPQNGIFKTVSFQKPKPNAGLAPMRHTVAWRPNTRSGRAYLLL